MSHFIRTYVWEQYVTMTQNCFEILSSVFSNYVQKITLHIVKYNLLNTNYHCFIMYLYGLVC